MNNPVSTYRLQFYKDFTFSDFEMIIPYLQKLGIGTVYASPIFEATRGSVHGYDGVNPHKINPEIGTEEQLIHLSERLNQLGIQWLQDIVPNHMAFDSHNTWLKDVLEKGQKSIYASFFDVPWTGKIYHGKIMLPFLGSPLEDVITKGELKIDFEEPRFVLKYFENSYPLRLRSYISILQAGEGEPNQAVQQLLDLVKDVQKSEEPEAYKETLHEFQLQLSSLVKNEKTKTYLKSCIQKVNDDDELVRQIAGEQVYQLCNWQQTDYSINFRRFFTVNGLICLNMQDKDVFLYYHKYIKYLLEKGILQGLRIDHIDGLFDPLGYLQQLRELTGEETYIVVEKILESGETMPDDWPIEGNTGYDFLAMVNNLFTEKGSKEQFTFFYKKLVNDEKSIQQQIHDKKSLILHENMGGELSNLYNLFIDMNLVEDNELTEIDSEVIKEAIGEFLIHCPVYRYYGNKLPLSEAETASVAEILNSISRSKPTLEPAIQLLQTSLLEKTKKGDTAYNARALRFYQRCMQFTGPLMAKGVEDTLMYTYNRFIGHNEVGDSPEAFGDSVEWFHHEMIERQQKWPLTMNGTSTHDTKRGEDVRARLNVLTDLPVEWFAIVKEWQLLNIGLKENGQPDANDEYLIYQTILGTFPMPGEDNDDFKNRLQDYLQKALREAKTHTNWATPNEKYEAVTKKFAVSLLEIQTPFWKSFQQFHKKITDFGIINSLAQVIIKFTSPGIPDTYQGTELWDLSLVDPDNRRLVDYQLRQHLLNELNDTAIEDHERSVADLWRNRYNGKIKMWLIHQLLNERKENKDFFSKADYLPLNTDGFYKSNVMAFAREFKDQWYVVAIPLHLAQLSKQEQNTITNIDWRDTKIILPSNAPSIFEQVFSGEHGSYLQEIPVKEIFKNLPFAVLKSR